VSVLIWINDVLPFAKTFDDYVQVLKQFFERLRKFNVIVKSRGVEGKSLKQEFDLMIVVSKHRSSFLNQTQLIKCGNLSVLRT